MKNILPLGTLLVAMACSGCGGAAITWTGDAAPEPAIPADRVSVQLDSCPAEARSVALLHEEPPMGSFNPGESLRKMKEVAAESGVVGVCDVHCAPPGTVGAGTCTAVAYRLGEP